MLDVTSKKLLDNPQNNFLHIRKMLEDLLKLVNR